MRSNAKITALILFVFGFFLYILYSDTLFFDSSLFGFVSKDFVFNTNNIFGHYSLSFLSLPILFGFLFLFPFSHIDRFFVSFGLLLLVCLAPLLFNIKTAGYYGIFIYSLIYRYSLPFRFFMLFLALTLSLFLIFFPARKIIVSYIMKFFHNGKTFPDPKNNQNSNLPWLSKIVYESFDKRIETPLFSSDKGQTRKFKLKNISEKSEEFNEVDTLSDVIITENIDSKIILTTHSLTQKDPDAYYNKLKETWPNDWKNIESKEFENKININTDYEDSDVYKEYYLLNDVEDIENEYQVEEYENLYDEDNIEQDYLDDYNIETEANNENLNEENYVLNNEDEQIDDDQTETDAIINLDDLKKFVDNNAYVFLEDKQNRNFSTVEDYHDLISEEDLIAEFPIDDTLQVFPAMELLEDFNYKADPEEYRRIENEDAITLEQTLAEFGIKADVCDIIHGPVVTLFKIIPAPGIKLSKIESLSDNLALRLAAQSIRIIAPIPGEKVVGIEVPNKKRELVSFKEVVNSKNFIDNKFLIPIGIGKDIYGNIIVIDLHKMPHVLIAGATGAGKSVCVNVFLSSILFSRSPDDVRLVLIDPKIVELQPYDGIPHLLTPVITDSKDAINALKYLVYEMEERYALLGKIGVRDISEYRSMVKSGKISMTNMPYIVAFVDEFADLMSTSGKEAELLFARLTAKARAIGIHLILATQRPSTDVITGLIKSNVPARFAFQVISYQDSRIILDQKGAEKLLGQGDMLYLSPSQPFPIRLQGAFLGKEEVDLIAEHWKSIAEPEYIDIEEILGIGEEDDLFSNNESSKDPLFNEALEIVKTTRKASASYLQRRLNIGYNRAARMVEQMEDIGIVGPMQGSKPREVIG